MLSIKNGDVYGLLEIIKELDPVVLPCGERQRIFLCKCKCGTIKSFRLANLRSGTTVSCGCYRRSLKVEYKNNKGHITHGLSDHSLYKMWRRMIERCIRPATNSFSRYGGRGISICDEWRNDFVSFYSWAISHGWSDGLQIDRINNDGNYEPSNCRFVTNKENCRNTSRNHLITHNGKTMCLTDWAEEKGMLYTTLLERIRSGWDTERAIETPVRKMSSGK